MIIPEMLKDFMLHARDITLGNSKISFLSPEELTGKQTGYAVDEAGNSLITGAEDTWQPGWLVIAKDHLGDPVFVDVDDEDLPVLTAPDGEGTWEEIAIADSMPNFKDILAMLHELAVNRDTPEALKANPVSHSERQKLINKIEKKNPGSIAWYWEDFLDNN